MHLSSAIASVALLASTCSAASSCWEPSDTSGSDKLAAESLKKLTRAVNGGCLKRHVESKGVPQACTLKNAAVRKEYSTLTTAEKLEYTRAVKCLMAKPSIGHPDVTPGAKSRYDDFVATHINQTRSIHQSGYFLSWHRHYVWVWEKALREECGYKGWQPYWNWGKSTGDVMNSPYFDGSETAQAANGVYEAHNCTRGLPSNLLCIEPGVGGGCVTTGPYANMVANLTATVPTWPGVKAKTPFSYDPRCIRHDISDKLSKTWSGDEHSVDLLTNPLYQTGVGAFQDRLAYVGTSTVGHYGLHQVGHFITNGDPSGDFFNSPNDPIFWLHHAQVDRTWWIWQNQKPVTRNFQIAGTRTMGNNPPSDNATIEDTFDMGYNGGRVAVKELLSTVAGPYCYIYL